MKQRIKESYRQLRATNILSNFFNLGGIQLSNILLIMLVIPIVTRIVGIDKFGIIMYASRFAQFVIAFVSYGTGQTGVRDVAFNIADNKKLGIVFYNTLLVRVIIFTLFIALLFLLQWFNVLYYPFLLLATPIVLAEVFNPLCFFIGAERIRLFNIFNLVSNVVCIIAILLFIKGPADAGWVNFILGMANTLAYLGLLIYFGVAFKLSFQFPLKSDLLKITKDNFYLTINNLSINLQQSIIIFALPIWGFAALLGPYTLCDRVIGQCRNLLITINNAIYPHTVHIYKQSVLQWNVYRRKTKYLIAGVFFAGSILIFILADFIVFVLSKEHNPTAILFLRIMAFVPAISALNVLNVLDQLLKNNTVYIFRIAIILFITAILVALISLTIGNVFMIGSFTLIVETSAWLMYEYIIKKPSIQNV
ncbi:MAG: oligosaccharide flippase family protein [Mucilaginibacter sp.]